jgi:hypothetical protein
MLTVAMATTPSPSRAVGIGGSNDHSPVAGSKISAVSTFVARPASREPTGERQPISWSSFVVVVQLRIVTLG